MMKKRRFVYYILCTVYSFSIDIYLLLTLVGIKDV